MAGVGFLLSFPSHPHPCSFSLLHRQPLSGGQSRKTNCRHQTNAMRWAQPWPGHTLGPGMWALSVPSLGVSSLWLEVRKCGVPHAAPAPPAPHCTRTQPRDILVFSSDPAIPTQSACPSWRRIDLDSRVGRGGTSFSPSANSRPSASVWILFWTLSSTAVGSLSSCSQCQPQRCWLLHQDKLEPASRLSLTPSLLSLTIQRLNHLKTMAKQMSSVQALNSRE